MPKKRILVLCVDVDNDLGEKARVRGPVVGRAANIEAATKLALADPEEADANTVFEAVRTAEQLGKDNEVEVATITGSSKLGFHAEMEIAKQLDGVLKKFQPEGCIFVSDGASDERVLPLIQSRVRVDGVKAVNIKQEKDLEKTYFVVLDKLKEPQMARIVFGLPGLALILFFFLGDIGLRWFIGLFGAYLLFKGSGLEDAFLKHTVDWRLRLDSIDFTFYFAAAPLLLASLWLAFSRVAALGYAGESNVSKLSAWFLKDLLLLLPVALLLIIIGRTLRAVNEKKNYLLPNYIMYGSSVLLFWLVLNNAAEWILGNVPFSSFFYSLILGVLAMYLVSYLSIEFRKNIISRMNIVGKDVYTELGSLVGKVAGVDKRAQAFIIKTNENQKIDLEFDHISNIGDSIIVKY